MKRNRQFALYNENLGRWLLRTQSSPFMSRLDALSKALALPGAVNTE